ncbi:MAG: Stress responsive alpha-beta barrel domain protein [Rhodoferax sp.]|nr:Stress responsive alpha-beta barrel domain protein [Rhodoferax sp.]
MIRHIVFWTFKDQAEGASRADNIVRAKALLDACAGLVPGILRFDVITPQPGRECTEDLALYSEFTDQAALDAYQNHPQHVALKPFIGTARLTRQCMDVEV